jgi:hypothetical protein
VVGLPHRPDGALDEGSWPLAPAGVSGGQVPETGAEVGTPEDGIRDEGDEQDYGDSGAHGTFSGSASGSSLDSDEAGSGLGP